MFNPSIADPNFYLKPGVSHLVLTTHINARMPTTVIGTKREENTDAFVIPIDENSNYNCHLAF